jgi:GYF domain 2
MKGIPPTPLRTPAPPRPLGITPITLPATPVSYPPAPASVRPPSELAVVPWRDWYVYQADGRHIGPLSTETLARAWLSGQVPQNVFVGALGDAQWWPLQGVPELLNAAKTIQEAGAPPHSSMSASPGG